MAKKAKPEMCHSCHLDGARATAHSVPMLSGQFAGLGTKRPSMKVSVAIDGSDAVNTARWTLGTHT